VKTKGSIHTVINKLGTGSLLDKNKTHVESRGKIRV
jgi:hypothetical protein